MGEQQDMGVSDMKSDRATHEQSQQAVSAVPVGIADAVVLVAAEDPDKTPLLYACAKCGSVHSPAIYLAPREERHRTAREAAENCYACKTHNTCKDCGAECSKYSTVCGDCRYQRQFNKAVEIPDNGGPYCVFGGDTYYTEIGGAHEEGVGWVSPCKISYLRLCADSILENLTSDMHEDASVDDLDGVAEFTAAVKAFNKAQKCQSWWPDETRRIDVAKAMAEQCQ